MHGDSHPRALPAQSRFTQAAGASITTHALRLFNCDSRGNQLTDAPAAQDGADICRFRSRGKSSWSRLMAGTMELEHSASSVEMERQRCTASVPRKRTLGRVARDANWSNRQRRRMRTVT